MMAADLDNVALLRRMLRVTAPSQDVDGLIAELRERVLEELDYRQEAANQQAAARLFRRAPDDQRAADRRASCRPGGS